MTRFLSVAEVLRLYVLVAEISGGSIGVRDLPALESAASQPQATFDGTDLYPTIVDKAAALCYFLVLNHPFVDGNKRTGHAAMETFLVLNGLEIRATLLDQEQVILALASGQLSRAAFTAWLESKVTPRTKGPA